MDFRKVRGRLAVEEKVALRNLALSIRLWPLRFTPSFVSLGAIHGDSLTAMRAGSPEAAISATTGSGLADLLDTSVGISITSIDPAAGILTSQALDVRPHLIYVGESDGLEQEDLDVWIERLAPSGYLVVHENGSHLRNTVHAVRESSLAEGPSVKSLHIFRKDPADEPTELPLLTVLTRTYQRPRQLAMNIASLKFQTDNDYQHIVIVDDDGQGLHAANRSLGGNKHRVIGRYVMVLDDDDALLDPGFVAGIRTIEHFKGNPQLAVFKVWRVTEVVPRSKYWEVANYHTGTHRVCNCYALRNDFFMETIDAFGVPRAGDQNWQKVIYQKKPSIFWWNRVVSYNMRIGHSEPENEE